MAGPKTSRARRGSTRGCVHAPGLRISHRRGRPFLQVLDELVLGVIQPATRSSSSAHRCGTRLRERHLAAPRDGPTELSVHACMTSMRRPLIRPSSYGPTKPNVRNSAIDCERHVARRVDERTGRRRPGLVGMARDDLGRVATGPDVPRRLARDRRGSRLARARREQSDATARRGAGGPPRPFPIGGRSCGRVQTCGARRPSAATTDLQRHAVAPTSGSATRRPGPPSTVG